ncbi:MAG: chemotaxis protein CheA [Calditrichaeota bacterium]|nr:chemotaxis protein CheA [Calditrichota bacterium]
MENFVELYKEETKELLNDIQDTLLELEEKPKDRELIDRVFRAMHNMKGNGAMFGFDNISAFTHDIETVYDKVREGELPVTPELINLTLEACDQINLMLLKPGADIGKQKEKVDTTLQGFAQLLPQKDQQSRVKSVSSAIAADKRADEKKSATYFIHFVPHEDIFLSGMNPILLLKELLELGSGHVIAHWDRLPEFEEMNPEKCYLYWTIILTTSEDVRAIQDVFIFVEDESVIRIETLDGEGKFSAKDIEKIKNTLIAEKGLSFEKLSQLLANKDQDESAAATQKTAEKPIREKKEEKKLTPSSAKMRVECEQASAIRVSSEKLDNLINLVGELVTAQASLAQTVLKNNDSRYLAIAEELERLTAGLRDIAMEIRLIPLGSLFGKYRRLVRDLARTQKKEINFVFEGGETELDKTIIDRLGDPLVHLIRNSIDHGIELPEIREKNGKPRAGTIRISARQSGADVWIQISDDGKGMDPEKIHARAVEKGIVPANLPLSTSEILQLIFKPGFSTAEEVSDISGRGVGMDVVKKNVKDLRGTVSVKSEVGKGTTISLRLPLTLGIIDGLVIKAGSERFVLPISVVQDCQEFYVEGTTRFKHREILEIRGEVISYIRLREHFAISGNPPERGHLVIAQVNDQKIGIVVDEIEGEHQIVIKSLGKLYRNVDGLSGATILGDGSVALILDAGKLIEIAEKEEFAQVQNL